VSEALAERESAGKIPSEAEGSALSEAKSCRFAGVSEAPAEREPAGEIPSVAEGPVLSEAKSCRFAGVSEAPAGVVLSHAPARQVETGVNKRVLNAEALRRGGCGLRNLDDAGSVESPSQPPRCIFSPRLRV